MLANYMSYEDKRTYATWEAMSIGRMHCLLPDWERAACAFSASGGFHLSDKVGRVAQETLILWGRQDSILDASTPSRFEQELPRSELVWVEQCGHVPHLEQAEFTARQIIAFAAR